MNLPFQKAETKPEIAPPTKLVGTVEGVFIAALGHFVTKATDALAFDFEGIRGDVHAGYTRSSGSREPWYPRGTEMRNERQISIVSPDELAQIACAMELREIRPEWIGANLLIGGVQRLSMLPSGTLLFFRGGVTLKVDSQNGPCSTAGRSIAEHAGTADHEATSLQFPKVAKRLRGLVAWVERPGRIEPGEDVSVRIPEQWIYSA